ncbi:MAG: hypothetical protein OJF55_001403 [Rhodanobacteraceae bacterium]|nr:MAG: hypothetical protein OJF55_001403 [Rhodanobacteraceae bacterium]
MRRGIDHRDATTSTPPSSATCCAALRRLNYAIRLDKQLVFLEWLTRQGASPAHS